MKMPFGKHKGKEVEDCPKQYLHWLCKQDWMKGDLKEECKEVVGDWTPPRRRRIEPMMYFDDGTFMDSTGIYEYNMEAEGWGDEYTTIESFIPNSY